MSDPSPTNSPDMTRRGFVGWAFGAGSAFLGLVVGIPLVGSVLGALPKAKPNPFVKVTDMTALTVGEPVGLSFVVEQQDAYLYEALPHSVWVVKDSEASATVFSPVCTHLGCQVYWSATASEFLCPCHGSVFGKDGTVIHGPALRALDTLPTKIEKRALYVQWVNYKPGIPTKTPV